MKRMSEVFDLPLHELDIAYCVNTSSEADALAARAINHVDALADAFESLVTDYNQYCAVNGIDITDDHCANLHEKMVDALLAAYRGEK